MQGSWIAYSSRQANRTKGTPRAPARGFFSICYNEEMKMRKGFTLIELLVVIAIVAILAVTVILTLNPAELLKQTRDSSRISDMATIKTALGIYLTDVGQGTLGQGGQCKVTVSSTEFWTPDTSGNWNVTNQCSAWFATAAATGSSTPTEAQSVTGNGWIPVNFNLISAGAPISQEPIDPVNTIGDGTTPPRGAFFYSYIADGTTFKLSVFMESQKYANGGESDVESTDGGINAYAFEVGTNLQL